jgi:hypothetical protein
MENIDTYKMYPVRIECHDPATDIAMFTITALDESAAEVVIDTPCNVREWDRIAPMIRKALLSMKFEMDQTE